jgi:CRP-like cAMP-binding protein
MDRLSAFAVIRDRSLFRLLKKVDAFELAGLAKVVDVPAGAPVPRDDRTDALYVVVEGRIDLHERSGENDHVSSVTKGRSLELATFRAAKEAWRYDWSAERETTLLRLPGDAVRTKIRNTPGLERYLDLVIADPGVRRLKNDLRLFGFGDETIRIVARMTQLTWGELSSEYSKRPGLALIERGALSVELVHIRKRHGLGPFTPGDYIYVGEGMGSVTATEDARVWFLPRDAWEKESSAERVESFLGLADPVTLKKSALGKLAGSRRTTTSTSSASKTSSSRRRSSRSSSGRSAPSSCSTTRWTAAPRVSRRSPSSTAGRSASRATAPSST